MHSLYSHGEPPGWVGWFVMQTIDYTFSRWDNTRFGVVQYSDDPRTEFLLADHLTLNEVMSAIDAMPYKGISQSINLYHFRQSVEQQIYITYSIEASLFREVVESQELEIV